jgi:hypothetical protein
MGMGTPPCGALIAIKPSPLGFYPTLNNRHVKNLYKQFLRLINLVNQKGNGP